MSSPASLLVRLWMFGVLAAAPALAAGPDAKPKASRAENVKAPAKAAAGKSQGTRPAAAAAQVPMPAGGSCPANGTPDDPMAPQRCAPSTVADLAISSMEDEDDWKPTPLPFTWDVPRVLDVIPMSEVIEANGFPVKLSAVLSAERPEVILQHMVDRFEAAGLYLPPDEHQPQMLREPQLTALDPMGLISYTFILQPNPNKTTTVILGETNVGKRRPPSSDVAPILQGASGVLHSRQEGVRTLAYAVGTPQADVRAFYARELGKLGFQEREPGLWRKGTEELNLKLHAGEGGQTAVVIIRRAVALDAPHGVVD